MKRFSQKSVERSGGAVFLKKFGAERSGGAEISENFDFFGVFHEFFANYCSKGTKRSQITPHALARCLGTFLKNIKYNTRYVSKNLCGAERSGGAEYRKIDGAERSWSGPLRSLRSAPLKSRSTAPRILNPGVEHTVFPLRIYARISTDCCLVKGLSLVRKNKKSDRKMD